MPASTPQGDDVGATRGLTATTIAALAAVTAVACGGGGSPAARESPARATPTTPSGPPTGVIAIGHSGLTGAANDPQDLTLDVRTNSWATGRSRQVHSIASRLATAAPRIAHPVANTAVDGSAADQLDDELSEAL